MDVDGNEEDLLYSESFGTRFDFAATAVVLSWVSALLVCFGFWTDEEVGEGDLERRKSLSSPPPFSPFFFLFFIGSGGSGAVACLCA